jgi:uncharacterized protein YecE (DUF72 family)
MNAVEINTSFHRPHRRTTYEKWAGATPAGFRFSVKVPKSVSHSAGLAQAELDRFMNASAGLGEKLASFLIQFPPTKAFDEGEARILFNAIRAQSKVGVVCESRHASWFTPEVDRWLADREISRVAADPARINGAGQPGGWKGRRYFRLHGAPRIYYSSYDAAYLCMLSERLSAMRTRNDVWCIFDNTASGAAMENALFLRL